MTQPFAPRRSLRARIGHVPHETLILHGSFAENIVPGAGREVAEAGIEAAAHLTNAHGFIAAQPDGCAIPLAERGTGLSPGQRRRPAFARVALRDRPILARQRRGGHRGRRVPHRMPCT